MTLRPMSRKEAIENRHTLPKTPEEAKTTTRYFYTGKPCRQGHDSPRDSLNSNRCVECREDSNHIQRSSEWYWVEQAKSAERRARNRAEKLGHLPPDYDMKECQRVYINVAMAEAMLEVPYEVDHKIPLTSGGTHHHDNLIGLPRWMNRDKGDTSLDEYLQGLFVKDMLAAFSYGKSIGETM